MATDADGRALVWMVLVERGLDAASEISLFWHEAAALDGARQHLRQSWPVEDLASTDDVLEAIEAANQLVGDEEHIELRQVPIVGHQHFEGDVDLRLRCRACREPIVLDDPGDPESWVHADDANDLGDHTAEHQPNADET